MSKSAVRGELKDEEKGKDIFRYAYAYAEKLDAKNRLVTSLSDVFHPDLVALRNKLQQKCEQTLYLSCSKRGKAEELLWKHVMYSVISHCKQHKEIFNPSHPFHQAYSSHLISATMYYQQLMQSLQDHYHIQINTLQLEDMDTTRDALWLRESIHRCFIYLGDLARYQVQLGFSSEHAVAYYQQAIDLDPGNGSPYNQLAALSESQGQPFQALFYYLRSMTAPKPFTGVEKNIERLFKKNLTHLTELSLKQETIIELEMPQFKKELLLANFLQLQNLFLISPLSHSKSVDSSNYSDIPSLCSRVSSLLEECLGYDITPTLLEEKKENQTVKDSTTPLLDGNMLLKLSALSILPAYNLRLKGSNDTLTACAFALSIFSQLLLTSYTKLLHSTKTQTATTTSNDNNDTVKGEEKGELSMMELLNGGREQAVSKSTKHKRTPHYNKRRRRRRRKRRGSISSDSSSSTGSEVESLNDNISSDEEEEEIDFIESLSDSSCTSDDDRPHPLTTPTVNLTDTIPLSTKESTHVTTPTTQNVTTPTTQNVTTPTTQAVTTPTTQDVTTPTPSKDKSVKTRRQFVLAANFSLANNEDTVKEKESKASGGQLSLDIAKLSLDTANHYNIHTACTLVGDEHCMTCIKVLIDWLLSYPAVIATYGKSSVTSVWSRLADLLNFLPNEQDLRTIGLLETDSCATWTQTHAITEDKVLYGFGPLIRVHQSLILTETSSAIQQAAVRIKTLIKFGHYIASTKSVPWFEYDTVSGKFIGPVQRERRDAKMTAIKEQKTLDEAKTNRSKLMKLMAHKRLESEVQALKSEATVQSKGILFTPYVLPDAQTLCHNLHLIKKLIQTRNFVIIIAKSVIESLDLMKKEKSNYSARDAIKFLERELQEGNKFIKAQTTSQSANPERKRSRNQDINQWLFEGLVDCAIYYNTSTASSTGSLITLLLDKALVDEYEGRTRKGEREEEIQLLTSARQHGVEIDSILKFYRRWQREGKR